MLWHKNALNAEVVRNFAGVKAAASAERGEDEITGVVAPLDRDRSDRALHVGIGDAQDAFRRRSSRHSQLTRDPVNDSSGAIRVNLHRPAEKAIRIDSTENDVRIRHGWQIT